MDHHALLEQLTTGNQDQVIADLRREVQNHPENTTAYQGLMNILLQNARLDEAIEVARAALSQNPADERAALQAAGLLMRAKRYIDVPAVLEKAIAAAPERYNLQITRAEALLRSGEKERGLAEAQKLARATHDPLLLNDLAYALADTNTALPLAQELARQVVAGTEEETSKPALASFEESDLARMNALAAEWDTLGWACFRQNDLASAEKYVEAGWQLAQHAAGADHLGQIYEKQGRHEAAIRMWRFAVAANSNEEDAKERLRLAGKSAYNKVTKGNKTTFTTPAEDLVQLRTIKIPSLPKQTATAEFFLLISPAGMEDVQFINGSDSLKDAAHAIREVSYKFPFPDAGPEKLIRRGILSCSTYTTPSCQLTLLLPSTARKN